MNSRSIITTHLRVLNSLSGSVMRARRSMRRFATCTMLSMYSVLFLVTLSMLRSVSCSASCWARLTPESAACWAVWLLVLSVRADALDLTHDGSKLVKDATHVLGVLAIVCLLLPDGLYEPFRHADDVPVRLLRFQLAARVPHVASLLVEADGRGRCERRLRVLIIAFHGVLRPCAEVSSARFLLRDAAKLLVVSGRHHDHLPRREPARCACGLGAGGLR